MNSEPQCRICKYWRWRNPPLKAGRYGKMTPDVDDLRRRCARVEDFFTLPNYLCRNYRSKEAANGN